MKKESYQYFRLENGIKVIQKEVDSPITHVGMVVNTGTRDELPEENGIAHFIEHTIFKSTRKRNTYQVLSYLESLVPVFYGIPGLRLGLANIVTVYTLYRLSAADACFVSAGRILLAALLFGNVTTMIYSLAGAVLSILVMILAKPIPKLSAMGVSILGGVFHNIGQVIVAAFLLKTGGILKRAVTK